MPGQAVKITPPRFHHSANHGPPSPPSLSVRVGFFSSCGGDLGETVDEIYPSLWMRSAESVGEI
jgi:hypothetical protein